MTFRAAFYIAFYPYRARAMAMLMILKANEDGFGREAMQHDRAEWTRNNGNLERHWA